MLVAVGVLLVTGWWDQAVTWLQIHLISDIRGVRVSRLDRPAETTDAPGELTLREMLRWAWRQLTSMRTALILLLLLALAAIPGSVIPQSDVDSLKTSRWQDAHPDLTPVYEKLGLFSVYDSVWFSAIYILLMVSLVGCIIPRTFHYWQGDPGRSAEGAPQPDPPAGPRGVPDERRGRRRPRPGARRAEEARLPRGVRRRRRGLGRARLPARGRQPALPHLRASWCWSASRSAACSATRAA